MTSDDFAERSPEADSGPASKPADASFEAAPSTSEAAGQPFVGRVIDGRYRIVRPLAKGGMGAVFVAEHLPLHREVAIKVIRSEFAGHGEIATRFAREAIATAQFEHPHVVSAIDYGALPEGGAYFVMQLVRGRSLRMLLKEAGALPWRRVCAIGAQVADALSAARARGIVHRDLKPDNVLVEVREDGSDLVKILDFGIARMDSTPGDASHEAMPGQALTRVGMVMGTPGYMAPEQAVGDHQLDHRADLYSLGVVLWEAITGRELWTGQDITSIITKQVRESPPTMASVVNHMDLPSELDDLVQQLLARNAAERPEHPGDVRDSLRALSLAPTGDWGTSRTLYAEAAHRLQGTHASNMVERLKPAMAQAQRWAMASPGRLLALGATVVLTVILMLPGNEDTPAEAAAGDQTTAPAQMGQDVSAAKADTKTSGVKQVMKAAGGAVAPTARALTTSSDPPLPKDLQAPVKDMLEGTRFAVRRRAARTILTHKPQSEVPKYLEAIANLESTGSCSKRRDALRELASLRDRRSKPSVERYYNTSANGCGFLGMSDCYRCIRGELRQTMKALAEDDS